MSKKEAAPEAALDEHGLVVHRYLSTVLVVVPASDFAETTLRYARSALYNVHVGTWSVATVDDALIKGELQDEFQVDGLLADVDMEHYSGVLFCGGKGSLEMTENPDVLRLAYAAASRKKLVAGWGHSVAVLARAGICKGRRVTGHPSLEPLLRAAGARYTGTQVERDGSFVTALDDAAGFRFGKLLVQVVGI